MWTHKFSQCIGTIDDTYIWTAGLNKNYPNFFKGRGKGSIFWILQSIKCFKKWQYHHVNRHRPYSSSPIQWSYVLLAPIPHEVVFGWWQYSRGNFFNYKWSSARFTNKNSFFTLSTLQWVLYPCLEFHKYFELQKKKLPQQSLVLALNG